jgi:hypothetical protein
MKIPLSFVFGISLISCTSGGEAQTEVPAEDAQTLASSGDAADDGTSAELSPEDEAETAPRTEAEAQFWKALNGQDHAAIPAVIAALQQAAKDDPSNPRTVVLLGLTYMWEVAESELSHLEDPSTAVQAAIAAFEQYQQMEPKDVRAPTWLGPALTAGGQGMLQGAAQMPDGPEKTQLEQQGNGMVTQGFDVLDKGVAAAPEFNLFGRFIVTGLYPIGSDRFEQSVSDIAQFHDIRLGAKLDPQNPDVSPFLKADSPCTPGDLKPYPYPATSEQTSLQLDPKCWNSWKTPYSFEGFWLFSGDIAMKNGDAAAAKVMYKNAQKLPESYAGWPYAYYLEDRIENVDAWAPLFQDDDPSNDPGLVFRSPFECILCHASPGLKPVVPPESKVHTSQAGL